MDIVIFIPHRHADSESLFIAETQHPAQEFRIKDVLKQQLISHCDLRPVHMYNRIRTDDVPVRCTVIIIHIAPRCQHNLVLRAQLFNRLQRTRCDLIRPVV